jgi:hypothetical protein
MWMTCQRVTLRPTLFLARSKLLHFANLILILISDALLLFKRFQHEIFAFEGTIARGYVTLEGLYHEI